MGHCHFDTPDLESDVQRQVHAEDEIAIAEHGGQRGDGFQLLDDLRCGDIPAVEDPVGFLTPAAGPTGRPAGAGWRSGTCVSLRTAT